MFRLCYAKYDVQERSYFAYLCLPSLDNGKWGSFSAKPLVTPVNFFAGVNDHFATFKK